MGGSQKARCRKFEVDVDVASGEGCPEPGKACKHRSECVIHAYMQEEKPAKAKKPRSEKR